MRKLELLAPAGTADIAIEAIKHGADAIYIGPPAHGARKAASNTLQDIKRAVDFAHIYGAKVYVTVNTILYDNELKGVEKMIRDLYAIEVDALIVQDMAVLRMDIPPIELHASTQCDIRTPEKARFLQEAGFSQLVLARELSIEEIREICNAVTVPVETFVHGALCVSYSGRCGAGYATQGRSGNRGECPQICRQAFTLTDASGKILAKDKYLLSLKDFRADTRLDSLIEAGVSSFKIEGRLKEAGYVKNVTAYYSEKLNGIIAREPSTLRRSSYGTSRITFTPVLEKSFNRGFTDYRLGGTPDRYGISSPLTPKSLGEPIKDIRELKPGDGISYFDRNGVFTGMQVNGIAGNKITGNNTFLLPSGLDIRRTSSVEWKKLMASSTAVRTLSLNIRLDDKDITAEDETGARITFPHGLEGQPSEKATDHKRIFEKLGNTPFRLEKFEETVAGTFYPASSLTALRRETVEKLLREKERAYKPAERREENGCYPFPSSQLDYRDNVSNRKAEEFYKEHGVTQIEPALELQGKAKAKGRTVMSTRHCVLRDLGLCLKNPPDIKMPLTLQSGGTRMRPEFDCARCEMHLRLL